MVDEWFKEYFGLGYILGDNTKVFGFNSLEERTQEDVNQILKFSQINSGSKILDIPCGYGRHAIELARRNNYQIYGLDINPFLLNVAKYRKEHSLDVEEKSINLKTKPTFLKGDMRKFSNKINNVDLIYNWFWSFGYFSHEENMKTLNEFFSALKSKGILLIQSIPKENLSMYAKTEERKFFPLKVMRQEYPGGILRFKKYYEQEKNILHTVWVPEFNDQELNQKLKKDLKPVESSVKIYLTDEYIKMMKEVGFKNVETYESYFPLKIFKGVK